MKPPIFILERNGDLSAYATAGEACASMESVDVEDGEYRAFDAEGRVLRIEPEAPTRRGRWSLTLSPLSLVPGEEQPSGQEQLRAALMRALPDPPATALAALVEHARRTLVGKR